MGFHVWTQTRLPLNIVRTLKLVLVILPYNWTPALSVGQMCSLPLNGDTVTVLSLPNFGKLSVKPPSMNRCIWKSE